MFAPGKCKDKRILHFMCTILHHLGAKPCAIAPRLPTIFAPLQVQFGPFFAPLQTQFAPFVHHPKCSWQLHLDWCKKSAKLHLEWWKNGAHCTLDGAHRWPNEVQLRMFLHLHGAKSGATTTGHMLCTWMVQKLVHMKCKLYVFRHQRCVMYRQAMVPLMVSGDFDE